jgi:uncharacterized membrane protein YccC
VHFATYLFIGPPIGGILWVLAVALYGASESSSHNGNALVTVFAVTFAVFTLSMFAVGGSYMIGGVAALVGGVIVALLGPLIPYRPIRPVFAGVVGALSSYFLWIPLQHLDQDDRVMAIIGGLSAAICSVLVELAESRRNKRRT